MPNFWDRAEKQSKEARETERKAREQFAKDQELARRQEQEEERKEREEKAARDKSSDERVKEAMGYLRRFRVEDKLETIQEKGKQKYEGGPKTLRDGDVTPWVKRDGLPFAAISHISNTGTTIDYANTASEAGTDHGTSRRFVEGIGVRISTGSSDVIKVQVGEFYDGAFQDGEEFEFSKKDDLRNVEGKIDTALLKFMK